MTTYLLNDGTSISQSEITDNQEDGFFILQSGELLLLEDGILSEPGDGLAEDPDADDTRDALVDLSETSDKELSLGSFRSWRRVFLGIVSKLVALRNNAPYDRDWQLGSYNNVPRRQLRGHGSFLSGEGMNPAWRDHYVDTVADHLKLVRYALPQELGASLPRSIRLGWNVLAKRKGAACPDGAGKVYKQNRKLFDPLSVTFENQTASRGAEWVVHRILNGALPCYLARTSETDLFEVEFTWDGLEFNDTVYELPNIVAQLRVRAGQATLRRITFQYRKPGGRLSDPWEAEFENSSAPEAAGWRQARAIRAFLSVYGLAAEIDRHIVQGHILTEFVLVNLREHSTEDNPLQELLRPRLELVDVANDIGDELVWGDNGLMIRGSKLSTRGFWRRIGERLGALDWKGFAPNQSPLSEQHYAPRAQSLYWGAVSRYVDAAIEERGLDRVFPTPASDASADERRWSSELRAVFDAVFNKSVEHTSWDGQPADKWFDSSELAFKADGEKAMSRVETLDDLRQFCRFVIYQATLGHGWANVRQYDDGGEPEYAAFGIAAKVSDPVEANESHWHDRAAALPCDAGNQLLQAFVLSYLPVSNVMDEVDPEPIKAQGIPTDPVSAPNRLVDFVEAIRGEYEALATRIPAIGDHSFGLDKIPSRPNA